MEIKFGDTVVVGSVLRRYKPGNDHNQWMPLPIKPREGLLIGWRTLSNGRVSWEDDGAVYIPSEFFKAGLVVFNERSKPVFVPLSSLWLASLWRREKDAEHFLASMEKHT
jgi:hypothetical protein